MSEFKKIFVISLVFYAVLSSAGLFYLKTPINRENRNDDTRFTQIEMPKAQGVMETDLNLYKEGEIKPVSISLEKNSLYNLTLENIGEATLFVYIVTNASQYTTTNPEPISIYSDELIRTVGIPFWGSYNWDTSQYSSEVSIGANLAVGATKSIIFYLDNSLSTATIDLTLIIKLQSTLNPYNNTIRLSWNKILIDTPLVINYSNTNEQNELIIPSNTINIARFVSKNGLDLTKSIFNETVSVNSSLITFQWRTDLNGNTIVNKRNLSGIINQIFVPEFENYMLTQDAILGLIINAQALNARLTWNFTSTPTTLNYTERLNITPEIIEMPLNQPNIIWRTFELPSNGLFTLNFTADPLLSLIFWDISVDFYSIGASTPYLFNLNSFPVNYSESATIFSASLINEYSNFTQGYLKTIYQKRSLYWSKYGVLNPTVMNSLGTQKLGVKITATNSLSAYINLYCKIEIIQETVENLDSNEYIKIGSENGSFFGDFKPFQVRKFTIENFTQYIWSVHGINETIIKTQSQLVCNNIDSGNYVNNMNNSLISIPINTQLYSGAITLEFYLKGNINQNDILHVQVRNSTISSPDLAAFTNIAYSSFTKFTYTISSYNDTAVQIVFNLTTNANAVNNGPVLDDIKVIVGTTTVFSDDFEGTAPLSAKWTAIDHSGAGNLWRIERSTASFNTPKINIMYPNKIQSFNAYMVDPYKYTNYTYHVYDYNPFVQGENTGYMVIQASQALIQNFSVKISPMALPAITMTNDTVITASFTNTQLVSQNGIIWEEPINLSDSYRFYRLNLSNKTYTIQFKTNNSPLIYFPVSVYDEQGKLWNRNINNFYGTLFINQTYTIISTENKTIYFNFGEIGFGENIQIVIIESGSKAQNDSTEPPQNDMAILVYVAFSLFAASFIINVIFGLKLRKLKPNK